MWLLVVLLAACGDDAQVQPDTPAVVWPHYTLDPSFGSGGIVIVEPGAAFTDVYEMFNVHVARAADGGFVVSAQLYVTGDVVPRALLCRLDSGGTGNCVRAVEGAYTLGQRAAAPHSDGMLLVYFDAANGTPAGVVHYRANGSRDTSYGGSGQLVLGPVAAMNVRAALILEEPDGSHVVVGNIRDATTSDTLWSQHIVNGAAQSPIVIKNTSQPIAATVLRRTPSGFIIGGANGSNGDQVRLVRTDLAFTQQEELAEPDCRLSDVAVLDSGDVILTCPVAMAGSRVRRLAGGVAADGFGVGAPIGNPNCAVALPDELVFLGVWGNDNKDPIVRLVSAVTGQIAGAIDVPLKTGWTFRDVTDAIVLPDGSLLVSGSGYSNGGILRPFLARYIRS